MRTLEAQGDEFYVEDGLRGNEGVSKSEKILGSEAKPEGRLLVVEPDFGFLPVQFDDRAAEVRCLSRSARSCRITEKTWS
nr:MAG: hypothetical protein J07AB56_06970 [Candidatus Nanosalinarum sp. J07AB56]